MWLLIMITYFTDFRRQEIPLVQAIPFTSEADCLRAMDVINIRTNNKVAPQCVGPDTK
ncbi:hypothetical protein HNP46_005711 [Pseudomonas nitritireducens]|uniref:Uncharacterized protein n=1 Tax=Pseudomonas nitroreducens TaxID=46680 RepID=A0A7W7KPX8_PSENT|nr:hypothetical protein [Pseudomonas nitritireducens]MBB4866804.1 hypothetical protein [Pseudomonas nitritireducens]